MVVFFVPLVDSTELFIHHNLTSVHWLSTADIFVDFCVLGDPRRRQFLVGILWQVPATYSTATVFSKLETANPFGISLSKVPNDGSNTSMLWMVVTLLPLTATVSWFDASSS